jgi:site-specific recombinase XerD
MALGADWVDGWNLVGSTDGSPLSPNGFSRYFARLVEREGLSGIRLHDLRHALITKLIKDGTPVHVVSRLAGHASATVTLAIYSHVDEEQIDRAGEAIAAAFGR